MIETMLAALSDWVTWWQGVLLIVLIALIIFYVSYRRRQM
jgi:type II secretory pathway component PulF